MLFMIYYLMFVRFPQNEWIYSSKVHNLLIHSAYLPKGFSVGKFIKLLICSHLRSQCPRWRSFWTTELNWMKFGEIIKHFMYSAYRIWPTVLHFLWWCATAELLWLKQAEFFFHRLLCWITIFLSKQFFNNWTDFDDIWSDYHISYLDIL